MFELLKRGGRWLTGGAAIFVLALAGCGGGGNAGTPVVGGGGNGTVPLTDLALVADKASISNSGTESVNVTITALTTGNAALTGTAVPVAVSVDAGAVITPSAKVTDTSTGQIVAKVSLVDRTSRTVTVTATSGSVTRKLSFNVIDAVNGSKVADLSIVLSKDTLANTGTDSLTATVTSLDANRSAIGGIPVALKIIDVGDAFVQASGGASSTDTATGQLTAKISLGNNHTNRRISFTVSSGTVVRSVSFDVVDVPVGTTPIAVDMSLVLSRPTVTNSGLDTVDAVLTAVDANRNAVAGVEVVFSVDSNAVLIPSGKLTDANGQLKATIGIGADKSNRLITVTATSKTLKRSASFSTSGVKLQATLQPGTLNAGESGKVEYTVSDVNGSGIAQLPITVVGPGTARGSGTTNDFGKWTYEYVANGSGPSKIVATSGNVNAESTVQINAAVPAVTATILSATFTATPNVVSVNVPGKSDNRAEMRVLFRSLKNEPVKNVRIRAGFGENSTSTDADISSGPEKTIYSDDNGIATFSVIPKQRPSGAEQLKVYACYKGDDTVEDTKTCPPQRLLAVALTIVEQPVSVSIGTDNLIAINTERGTYSQDFTVQVVDSAGNPKSNVQISPVIDLLQYGKGFFVWDAANKIWVQNTRAICDNEDRNDDGTRNGTIETGEDVNGNGQLDPRKSDVAIYMVGSTKTDTNGLAKLRIEYVQSMGAWLEYSIRASAGGVLSPPAWWGRVPQPGSAGTLNGTQRWVAVPLSALKNEAQPPFWQSSYGTDSSCSSPN